MILLSCFRWIDKKWRFHCEILIYSWQRKFARVTAGIRYLMQWYSWRDLRGEASLSQVRLTFYKHIIDVKYDYDVAFTEIFTN